MIFYVPSKLLLPMHLLCNFTFTTQTGIKISFYMFNGQLLHLHAYKHSSIGETMVHYNFDVRWNRKGEESSFY